MPRRVRRRYTAPGSSTQRASGRLSPYNGLVVDDALAARLARELGDDRLWSPTQLESYAKCPWSYLSARFLRVSRLDDPGDEMDAATRGSLLHDALRRFYQRAADRSGGPVFLRAADLEWAEPLLLAALDDALAEVAGTRWLGSAVLLPAKREELRRLLGRFLAWEVQEHEDMDNPRKRNAPRVVRTGVAEHELAFQDVVLERNGVRIRFHGAVDRVEAGVDPRFDASRFVAAVDYKTTAAAAPGGGDPRAWEDGVVLQVPLYAYAMTQARPGAELSRVGISRAQATEDGARAGAISVRQEVGPGGAERRGRRRDGAGARSRGRAREAGARRRVSGRAGAVVRLSAVLPRARDLPRRRRSAAGAIGHERRDPDRLAVGCDPRVRPPHVGHRGRRHRQDVDGRRAASSICSASTSAGSAVPIRSSSGTSARSPTRTPRRPT